MQALILPSPLNSRDPRDDKTRLFRRRAVALPELRSLHLNARVLELHYLLQHLVIPCGILSKLECLADTTDIEHTNSDIWSTVSSKFSDMVGPNALQKVVMAQRISGMTLTARTGDDVVSLDVISELQIVLPGVESHSFLLQLCDILPFGQVRLLVADPCLFPDNKSTLWLPTLGNFDMVEDLVIGHFQYPHRPVEILQQLFTELASSGDQPAMPCLQNLVLEQFDLSRVVTYSSGDDSFSRVDFCRTLTKWLKRRILHGQCVKRVEFVRCRGVTEGVLAQLDGVVEKVANTLPWD